MTSYLKAEPQPGQDKHGSVNDVRQVWRDDIEEGDPQVDVVQKELAEALAQN